MVGKFEENNYTLHYYQGMNDTIYYAYDIFSSYSYHKKLSAKICRALIFSGDHDLTFPYVGVEQCISSLNLEVEAPWDPFYVDNQVGGYLTKYVLNNYSLSYATIKGSGHVVDIYKPKEAFVLKPELNNWDKYKPYKWCNSGRRLEATLGVRAAQVGSGGSGSGTGRLTSAAKLVGSRCKTRQLAIGRRERALQSGANEKGGKIKRL
ncbi:hypothetical protein E3N88_00825 [Mikania micrantha]|uniref:Peptidase S10 serine carboxypeptidase n=1 Tax=Mikania micrantha TaxID=192012 RepID=A0A5N6PZ87_9ASTR|nr:hypothetical protein E3N88_00825 [Mikania micrantha]